MISWVLDPALIFGLSLAQLLVLILLILPLSSLLFLSSHPPSHPPPCPHFKLLSYTYTRLHNMSTQAQTSVDRPALLLLYSLLHYAVEMKPSCRLVRL